MRLASEIGFVANPPEARAITNTFYAEVELDAFGSERFETACQELRPIPFASHRRAGFVKPY
jgi:hypothetical protein